MTDWITDRLPTEADADKYGFVTTPGLMGTVQNHWSTVMRGAPWRHTTIQGLIMAKSHKFTVIPRKFTSITYANNRYIALADDGTAWEDYGHGWRQIHPLPAREVME